MKIIGVGIGRTGTLSLKIALEKIGFNPCYHMFDVFKYPSHIKKWLTIGNGKDINWEKLFEGYKAGVDFPFPTHFQKYLEAFPEVKVILTVRDPEQWYESARETVYLIQCILIKWLPGGRKVGKSTIWHKLFNGRFEDRDYAIKVFNKHIEEVKCIVPNEQLLVFNVKEGWEPLCNFLDVPIPDKVFPHVNHRSTIKLGMAFASIFVTMMLIGIMYVVYRLFLENLFPF